MVELMGSSVEWHDLTNHNMRKEYLSDYVVRHWPELDTPGHRHVSQHPSIELPPCFCVFTSIVIGQNHSIQRTVIGWLAPFNRIPHCTRLSVWSWDYWVVCGKMYVWQLPLTGVTTACSDTINSLGNGKLNWGMMGMKIHSRYQNMAWGVDSLCHYSIHLWHMSKGYFQTIAVPMAKSTEFYS